VLASEVTDFAEAVCHTLIVGESHAERKMNIEASQFVMQLHMVCGVDLIALSYHYGRPRWHKGGAGLCGPGSTLCLAVEVVQ
jgi:hypothetical protein